MNKTIYLDNAATTFPKPECVYKKMDEFYRECGVNAGRSSYKLSRIASMLIDDTRGKLAKVVNLESKENIIFSPSATISLNQILNGLDWSTIKNVYVSPFEHNATMRTLNYLKNKYIFNIHVLDFDDESFELKIRELRPKLAQNIPDLICVSHVSNVTGYILPIEAILEEVKTYNPIVILDCSQSIGLVDLDLKKINVDFAVFAGHKTLYGPFGIAGYINNNSKVNLKEFIVGGTGSDSTNLNMPEHGVHKYEAGSYNVQAIAGLNAALVWLNEIGVDSIYKKKKQLTEILVMELEKVDGIEIYLPKDRTRHIGIVSLNVIGYNSEDVAKILDEEFDIAVRAGHHCAPYFGEFLKIEQGTVRVSIGYFNSNDDIRCLIESLREL